MRSISSFFLIISLLVRLLLIASCKAMSTLSSAASKHQASTLCGHPCTETELSCSLHLTRMIGSLSFVTHLIYSKSNAVKRIISLICGLISDYGIVANTASGVKIRKSLHSEYFHIIYKDLGIPAVKILYYPSFLKHQPVLSSGSLCIY